MLDLRWWRSDPLRQRRGGVLSEENEEGYEKRGEGEEERVGSEGGEEVAVGRDADGGRAGGEWHGRVLG